jgi:hypothetical protein
MGPDYTGHLGEMVELLRKIEEHTKETASQDPPAVNVNVDASGKATPSTGAAGTGKDGRDGGDGGKGRDGNPFAQTAIIQAGGGGGKPPISGIGVSPNVRRIAQGV